MKKLITLMMLPTIILATKPLETNTINEKTLLGRTGLSNEYKTGWDIAAHKRKAKIEKNAYLISKQDQVIARLSVPCSLVSVTGFERSYTLRNNLLEKPGSVLVLTYGETGCYSERAIKDILGLNFHYDKKNQQLPADSDYYTEDIIEEREYIVLQENLDVKNHIGFVGVIGDYVEVDAQVWTRRWLLWGWAPLKKTKKKTRVRFATNLRLALVLEDGTFIENFLK